MHVVKTKFTSKTGKTYERTLIRESYREGKKVKKRTIANISHCSEEEVEAIRLALKHKKPLESIGTIKDVKTRQGISFGAILTVYEVANKLGIQKSLETITGSDKQQSKLALWQVIARVIDQGSRLSAVRMARDEASDEILHFTQDFNEESMYKNLAWLGKNQEEIEQELLKYRKGEKKPSLFLYDVTSSYLEGKYNELANWGYNRDKKRGKKQIVAGLMCDEDGIPVSIEVFMGNTQDTTTFKSQIEKAKERFGCEKVVFVGDKGMIKSKQIKDLEAEDYHYITAITKPQIEKFLDEKVFQMELFDKNVVEVEHKGVRYILRKNATRAQEIAQTREEKEAKIKEFVADRNQYLKEHPKAKTAVAQRKVNAKISRLKVKKWMDVEIKNRELKLQVDENKKEEESKLDGCYCIKTDLPEENITPEKIHDQYKALSQVEWAFRTSKTAQLEMRPLYVLSELSTRGHMLICMLAYMVVQELSKNWAAIDITVEEGLKRLRTLCTTIVQVGEGKEFHNITKPNKQNQELLDLIGIELPPILSKRQIHVDTRKKLIREL